MHPFALFEEVQIDGSVLHEQDVQFFFLKAQRNAFVQKFQDHHPVDKRLRGHVARPLAGVADI
ncbi:hypothetical protein [Nitratireductor luteus]|uniref:hypothetical protein n=1 Tax=Nitratireductor luteus TaxID=2976980 RepID=UPI0022409965|nr:hypothetical protein [Nitratireductor luteus]